MRFARLTKGLRSRAALAAAALYAVCVLMPHAAVALGSAGHCLTDDHRAAHIHKAKVAVHHHGGEPTAHDDATDSHKHSKADNEGGSANCCGLFCISAIAGDPGPMLLTPLSFAADLPALAGALTGRDPGRLHRPPIR